MAIAGSTTPGGAAPTAVELLVEGMHCDGCASLIEETLSEDPRVQQVAVDLEGGRASVVCDPGAISAEELCAAVAALGYTASPLAAGAP